MDVSAAVANQGLNMLVVSSIILLSGVSPLITLVIDWPDEGTPSVLLSFPGTHSDTECESLQRFCNSLESVPNPFMELYEQRQ